MEVSTLMPNPPSCGWEKLHRGNGKLVRIPAIIEDYAGISWYHCRFTLPELWQEKQIVLMFDAAGPEVEVYLNEIWWELTLETMNLLTWMSRDDLLYPGQPSGNQNYGPGRARGIGNLEVKSSER